MVDGRFSPDIIGQVGTYCLVMQGFEIGLIKFGLYLLHTPFPVLDLVAFTGYKYSRYVASWIDLVLSCD